jgi:hypothetical protein
MDIHFPAQLVFPVMAGLVPAIHVLGAAERKNVDARDKPGHDDFLAGFS